MKQKIMSLVISIVLPALAQGKISSQTAYKQVAGVITSLEKKLLKQSTQSIKQDSTFRNNPAAKIIPPSAPKEKTPAISRAIKPWTLMIYMAANNNLHSFAVQNLREMAAVGSSDNINIIVQFDGIREGKIKRYFIERGRARLVEDLAPDINSISGTPQSLYQFVKWGYENYPAERIAIDLWNHGSGIKDPSIWGKFLMHNRDALFIVNPDNGLLSLNRRLNSEPDEIIADLPDETRNFFTDIALAILEQRGIAFNDQEEVYIDNRQLRIVLENICKYVLVDKKIDIVFMDACHMSMVELASKLRPFVNYMVGSSEVEPGRGYNYERFLATPRASTLSARAFALHGVLAYEQEYKGSYEDYTQAVVDLGIFGTVENAIKALGIALNQALGLADSGKVFDLIKVVRLSSKYTTEFYDPDYIDAGDLFANLSTKSREFLNSYGPTLGREQYAALETINTLSTQAYTALTASIIGEVHGKSLPRSCGLGIFFPKRTIHSSYIKTTFNTLTGWSEFLKTFLTQLKYTRSMAGDIATEQALAL